MSDKTHLISFFLFLDYGYAAYLKWSPVPSGKLLLVNKRNRTCRMHLLHLRSVKWGPPLSKVGTCSKFSLFRKRGIFRQLARFICESLTSDALSYPFNEIKMPSETLPKELGT